MTPLHLLISDTNFHWPSVVQSLVYRIYENRKRELGRPFMQAMHTRTMDMIKNWAQQLVGQNGSIIDYNLNFREFDVSGYIPDFRQLVVELNIQTRDMTMYNITIMTNRNMNECCDVSCSDWKMRGVNIFEIKYVDEIINHQISPAIWAGASSGVSGFMGRTHNEADMEVGKLHMAKFDDNFLGESLPPYLVPKDHVSKLSHEDSELLHTSLREALSIPKPVKEESKEFTEMKNRILGWAADIKFIDSQSEPW